MADLGHLLATFVFLVPASLLSVEAALSVSIFEILLGVVARNVFGMETFPFLKLTAAFAGIVLTFLAGTEVDTRLLRVRFKESFAMGLASFAVPFAAVLACCYLGLNWSWEASEISAIALSTTSLAVVYAVLLESSLVQHVVGKMTMAACFVTDFFVALALSTMFVKPTGWTALFAVVSVAVIALAPRTLERLFARYGGRVIEVEVKILFLLLLLLMVLGELGSSHAMLPAFVLGLVTAPLFERNRALQGRLRTVCFAFITPFFFFNGGLRVPVGLVLANLGLVALLFALKMVTKLGGVYPLARRCMSSGHMYLSLLMSTGLTMGTLTATYGLEKKFIDEVQFGVLLAVVIGSAVVPTIVAQRWFQDELLQKEPEPAAPSRVPSTQAAGGFRPLGAFADGE